MRGRRALASALGDTGAAGGAHWTGPRLAMWPTQTSRWLWLVFVWANRIESSGSHAAWEETTVHSARLWLCLFGQPARITAAPALAATSSPVSQSAKTRKKKDDGLPSKLSWPVSGTRSEDEEKREKRGREHVPARKGHPSRFAAKSYGGTCLAAAWYCSGTVAVLQQNLASGHRVRVQVQSHYARDTADGTAPTLSLAVLVRARSSTCRVPSALWLLYSPYLYPAQR
jgi:hypothetical protein